MDRQYPSTQLPMTMYKIYEKKDIRLNKTEYLMSLLIDLFCMASNSIAIHNSKKNAKDLDAVVTDNRINMRTYI